MVKHLKRLFSLSILSLFILTLPLMGSQDSSSNNNSNSSSMDLTADRLTGKRKLTAAGRIALAMQVNHKSKLSTEDQSFVDSKSGLGELIKNLNGEQLRDLLSKGKTELDQREGQRQFFQELPQVLSYQIFKNYLNCLELSRLRSTDKVLGKMARGLEMPTGNDWIQWVNGLIEKNNLDPEAVLAEIASACARCPNPVRELESIAKLYFNDVPEHQRFWNWDQVNNQSVVIANMDNQRTELQNLCDRKTALQKEIKQLNPALNGSFLVNEIAQIDAQRKELLGQLVPGVKKLQPYAFADAMISTMAGKKYIGNNVPIVPQAIDGDVVDQSWGLAERWLIRASAPAKYKILLVSNVFGLMPCIRDCLAKQICHQADKKNLETQLALPVPCQIALFNNVPFTAETFAAEDAVIAMFKQHIYNLIAIFKQRIYNLQQGLRGSPTFLLGSAIPTDRVEQALKDTMQNFGKFMEARANSINKDVIDVAKSPAEKGRLYARKTELGIESMPVATDKLSLCRQIALCFFNAFDVDRTGPLAITYLKNLVAFAEQAIVLAESDPTLSDVTQVGDAYNSIGRIYFEKKQYADARNYYMKASAYYEQEAEKFAPKLKPHNWRWLAIHQINLMQVCIAIGSKEAAVQHLKNMIGYLEKVTSVTAAALVEATVMRAADGPTKAIELYKKTKELYWDATKRAKDLASTNPEVSEIILNMHNRIAEIDQKITSLEQAANQPLQIVNNNNNINNAQ